MSDGNSGKGSVDEHIMEMLGRCRVKVRGGRVVESSQPQIDYCPLFAKVRAYRSSRRRLPPATWSSAWKGMACFLHREGCRWTPLWALAPRSP